MHKQEVENEQKRGLLVGQTNGKIQLKSERHQRIPSEATRPRSGEQLVVQKIRLNMNFVHSKSQERTKSELDLFLMLPTQVKLENGHWIDYQPISSVTDSGPITFLSPGTEDYVDLLKTILVVRAKVTKADDTNLDADEKVGVVNNFLHSLLKQDDVHFKERQVTQAMGTYSYRSYLETLLNYGPFAKESQLTAALFYKGTAGKTDVADPALRDGNKCFKARYTFSKTSGVIELAGPVFCDVFSQNVCCSVLSI